MADTIEYRVRGVEEMDRLLKELGPAVSKKLGAGALRAMAKPIVEEAQRLVAIGPGPGPHIRDNIRTYVPNKIAADGERVGFIGFDRSVSWRAHFLEFGTARMAARPFMRPALDAKSRDALVAMSRYLARGLAREARKLAKPIR